MLTVKHLNFSYDDNQVLNDLSLSFAPGEIHGILGANGAGKTTFFQVIYGLLSPSDGEVSFPDEGGRKPRIAYLETENSFYPYMKGIEYIELLSHGNPGFNIDLWNDIFKIPLDNLIHSYSSGMKKKLALLDVISLDRPILLLDEPFNGLDLETVENFNMILTELKKKNKIIVITSHILQVLKTNCDRISFLNKGTIKQSFEKKHFEEIDSLIRLKITQNSDSVLRILFQSS